MDDSDSPNLNAPQPAIPTNKASWRDAIRGNVLAMGLVSLFTDFSSEMMNPLLPIFIAGLVPVALAPVYLGVMDGVAEATASLLKIFSGRISDRLRKRKALVGVGYGLSSFARPLMAAAMAGWHIIALKFLDRVGKGIRTSPRDALIGDSVDASRRGLAFGFHRGMDHVGAVLGPLAAIAILLAILGTNIWNAPVEAATPQQTPPDQMSALRWLFFLAIVPGIAAMAALVFKVREIVPPAKEGNGPLKGWRDLPKRFYAFVAINTLFALGNSSDLFIVYLGNKYFGLGLGQVMVLWIALHLSKMLFSAPGGAISDKIGRRPVLLAAWSIYALVYLGLGYAAGEAATGNAMTWLFWVLVIIYGLYYGLAEGTEKAVVADFVPSGQRGSAFGLYHGADGLAKLPANLIFGILWAAVDQAYPGWGPRTAFGIGAILAGAATLLLAVLLSRSHPQVPAKA